MQLVLLPGDYTILSLRELPRSLLSTAESFYSLTVTGDEISLVCRSDLTPLDTNEVRPSQAGYRALRIAGSIDFSEVGILAGLTRHLAEAAIPVFAVSTYQTDYLLVPGPRLAEARAALVAAGHTVTESV